MNIFLSMQINLNCFNCTVVFRFVMYIIYYSICGVYYIYSYNILNLDTVQSFRNSCTHSYLCSLLRLELAICTNHESALWQNSRQGTQVLSHTQHEYTRTVFVQYVYCSTQHFTRHLTGMNHPGLNHEIQYILISKTMYVFNRTTN